MPPRPGIAPTAGRLRRGRKPAGLACRGAPWYAGGALSTTNLDDDRPTTARADDTAGVARRPAPPCAGQVIKHYELIREVGVGGMGVVFLARDVRLGRLVAVKLLLAHAGASAPRFLEEARVTARCRHENIVVIYDVGEWDGYPYLVLEYIPGRTLREAMTDGVAPTAAAAVELMLPVARALACAHAMGIVHRDLKPENILLAESGRVLVVDFGIAAQVAPELAVTVPVERPPSPEDEPPEREARRGTLPYMSPEQRMGEPVDVRSDIWAAGVILFELTVGRHPLAPLSWSELAGVPILSKPMPSAHDALAATRPLADLIDGCLKKRAEERLGSADELVKALERLGAQGRLRASLAEDESPFAGLAAFQEADAGLFFGRDDEIAAVVGRLRQQQLVAVAGPSGAGKSSFVRAGVIPALKRSGRDLSSFVLRPGRRPLVALAGVLAHFQEADEDGGAVDPVAVADTLQAQPGHLGARLRARCKRRGPDHRFLLFVDQLEELYTLGADPAEQAAFAACLEGVADDASSPLRVVVAIRADFLDRVAEDRGFLAALTRGLVFLPPMTPRGMCEALERPLAAARHAFEDDGLAGEMLAGVAGTKSPLPLLQFTAMLLWEARDRDRRLLTRDAYRAIGGVAGALSTHADAVLAAMPAAERRLARTIFLRLVTPARTRAIVHLDDLDDSTLSNGHPLAAEQVVAHLVEARLLAIEAATDGKGTTLELAHESLIDRWATLQQWLDEDEQDAQFLAELRSAAEQWEKNGKAQGFLWHDQAARRAEAWIEQRRLERGTEAKAGLGARERGYLEAVVRLAGRTRRRRTQLVTALSAALLVVFVAVSLLAGRARAQARRADQQAGRADEQARQAQVEARQARNATRMAAARERQADPTTALALLREIRARAAAPGVGRVRVLGQGRRRRRGGARPRRRRLVRGVEPRRPAHRLRVGGHHGPGVGRRRKGTAPGPPGSPRPRPRGGVEPRRPAHRVRVGRQDRAGMERRRRGTAPRPPGARRPRPGARVEPRRPAPRLRVGGQDAAGVERRRARAAPGPPRTRRHRLRSRVEPRRPAPRVRLGGQDGAGVERRRQGAAPRPPGSRGPRARRRVEPRRPAPRLRVP